MCTCMCMRFRGGTQHQKYIRKWKWKHKATLYAAFNWILLKSKWFEPRSISYVFGVIFRVRIVFRKTVVCDWHFDYLSGSHLQSQVKSQRQMTVFMPLVLVLIGQFCRDVICCKTWKLWWLVSCCFAVFDPSIVCWLVSCFNYYYYHTKFTWIPSFWVLLSCTCTFYQDQE